MSARTDATPLAPTDTVDTVEEDELKKLFAAATIEFADQELAAVAYVVTLLALDDVASAMHLRLLAQAPVGEANDIFEDMRHQVLNACGHDEATNEVKTPEGVVDVVSSFEMVFNQLLGMGLIMEPFVDPIQNVIDKANRRLMEVAAKHAGVNE